MFGSIHATQRGAASKATLSLPGGTDENVTMKKVAGIVLASTSAGIRVDATTDLYQHPDLAVKGRYPATGAASRVRYVETETFLDALQQASTFPLLGQGAFPE